MNKLIIIYCKHREQSAAYLTCNSFGFGGISVAEVELDLKSNTKMFSFQETMFNIRNGVQSKYLIISRLGYTSQEE